MQYAMCTVICILSIYSEISEVVEVCWTINQIVQSGHDQPHHLYVHQVYNKHLQILIKIITIKAVQSIFKGTEGTLDSDVSLNDNGANQFPVKFRPLSLGPKLSIELFSEMSEIFNSKSLKLGPKIFETFHWLSFMCLTIKHSNFEAIF